MDINSAEIRKILKNILQQIKGQSQNKQLNLKVKYLFNNLNDERKKMQVKAYHDSRFSFLQEGFYYTTNKAKNSYINKKTLQLLYNEIKAIFAQIQKKIYGDNINTNLDYAIYFKDKEGKIKRASLKQIPSSYLRRSSKNFLKSTGLQKYLRQIDEQEKTDKKILDINQHLGSFIGVIQATYKGQDKPIPNRTISYGRLTEAFERHLQESGQFNNSNVPPFDAPPWNYNEIWKYLRESTSNVPWYLTGDVNATQVKYIGSGDVRFTTGSSIQDILNFFNYILTNEIDDDMINNVYKIFIQQIENASDNEIKQLAYEDINNLNKELLDIK